MARPSLLIIGADPDLRAILVTELAGRDVDPVWADDLAAGRAALKQSRPNAVLIDFGPSGAAALELITEISAIEPTVPVITVLAEDDLRIRVEAARRGTRMLLQKPLSGSELGEAIARVLNQEGTLQARVLVLSHEESVREKTRQAIESEVTGLPRSGIRVAQLQHEVAAQAHRYLESDCESSPLLLLHNEWIL